MSQGPGRLQTAVDRDQVSTITQYPQRDGAAMADEIKADSVDGSANPTGEAKQEYGAEKGVTFTSLEHEDGPTGDAKESGPQTFTADAETKVVDSPKKATASTKKRAESK